MTIRTTTLGSGRHLTLVEQNGWEFVTRATSTGVVAIVARTNDDELVLIEQHRPPAGGEVIELPAGLVGDDGDAAESTETAARRELLEETGYTAERWMRLGTCISSAGLTDERLEFHLATGLTRIAEGGGVGSESIRVRLVPLDDVDAWLADRSLADVDIDAKVYAGLAMARRVWSRPNTPES